MDWEIREADCVEAMAAMDEASIDAIVCDPPYELGFMGQAWDSSGVAYRRETWEAALRVLKPGGHLLAFGGTRTYHRLACAIEDAGFEIRDCIAWHYATGFPKSLDVSKAIDKAAGHWRGQAGEIDSENGAMAGPNYERTDKGDPITEDAKTWGGWGTALKPAHEPIVVARKPLIGTVAANVLEHGTGALNIDGCRIEVAPGDEPSAGHRTATFGTQETQSGGDGSGGWEASDTGRWPANVALDPEAAAMLDKQSGTLTSGKVEPHHADNGKEPGTLGAFAGAPGRESYGDTGGASRFFYCAKASSSEREAGLAELSERATDDGRHTPIDNPYLRGETLRRNVHPTVKPIELMRWLVRLVTPPGGLVLDPFAGSGTTGCAAVLEGFDFIGIERESEYARIARARIEFWAQFPGQDVEAVLAADARAREQREAGQGSLL